MGASGNLSIISLEKYNFEQIKNKILEKLLDWCPSYSDSTSELEEYYFKVSKLETIEQFIRLFNSKIVDYCPDENGICINGKFYDGWAGETMPQIIDNHLILYDTDQQMYYQSLPVECLKDFISIEEEIWT
jgi:hypothetical protein